MSGGMGHRNWTKADVGDRNSVNVYRYRAGVKSEIFTNSSGKEILFPVSSVFED